MFTFNMDAEERPEDYGAMLQPEQWEGVRFCTYSLELGEGGNLHYQGYLETFLSRTLAYVKKLAGLAGAHWEKRRGTQAQAIAYAEKVLSPFLRFSLVFADLGKIFFCYFFFSLT